MSATFCDEMTQPSDKQNWLKFGQWLVKHRGAKGYSQTELAKIIGKDEQTVYRIEKGQSTKRKTVIQLAQALDANADEAVAIAFGLPPESVSARPVEFNYSQTLAQIHEILGAVPPEQVPRLIAALVSAYGMTPAGDPYIDHVSGRIVGIQGSEKIENSR